MVLWYFTIRPILFVLGVEKTQFWLYSQGVYPQTDDAFRWVDIDASKVFVDLWVHLSFAIFCYFQSKKTTKITWNALWPSSNMLNISLVMGMISY